MTPMHTQLGQWKQYNSQKYYKAQYYNNTTIGTSSAYTMIPVPWTTNGTMSQQITMAGNYFDDTQYQYVSINGDQPERKRRYLPPPLEFNKYVNGSDLLEEFIAFVGSEGVRQGEVLQLPIKLFIQWLIVRAFEADNEEPPADVELTLAALPTPRLVNPRCTACGRYVSPRNGIALCNEACAAKHFARRSAA